MEEKKELRIVGNIPNFNEMDHQNVSSPKLPYIQENGYLSGLISDVVHDKDSLADTP